MPHRATRCCREAQARLPRGHKTLVLLLCHDLGKIPPPTLHQPRTPRTSRACAFHNNGANAQATPSHRCGCCGGGVGGRGAVGSGKVEWGSRDLVNQGNLALGPGREGLQQWRRSAATDFS
jgi:hypothetical protein